MGFCPSITSGILKKTFHIWLNLRILFVASQFLWSQGLDPTYETWTIQFYCLTSPKHQHYFAVCCWVSANECSCFCSWWAILRGFRLWLCCLLHGLFLFLLCKCIIWCALSLLSSTFEIVDAGFSDFFCLRPCGCPCIWSRWSLGRFISLHDLACSGWSLEVIILVL